MSKLSHKTFNHYEGGDSHGATVDYKIPIWDYEAQFKINTINYIVGKRGAGKSTFFAFLYSLIDDQIDECFVLSSRPDPEKFSKLTCLSHIFSDIGSMDALIEYFKHNPLKRRILVIETGMLKPQLNSFAMQRLFTYNRDWNVTVFIISQYPYNFNPHMRSNIDHCYFFCDNIQSNQQKLYQQFGGMVSSFDHWKKLTQQSTHNFTSLIINNNQGTLSWYKAPANVILHKKTQEVMWKSMAPIESDQKILLKAQLKQLQALCSQILNQLNKMD